MFKNHINSLFKQYLKLNTIWYMYWYRYYEFFHYINSLWKHFINVPRLIWSSVVMIESENSWKHVSICELESYNYKHTLWLKQEKVKRPRKVFQVFQRKNNAVLWREIRRPTQMLARAPHASHLTHFEKEF